MIYSDLPILICMFTYHTLCHPGAVLVVAVSFNCIRNTSKPHSATLPPNLKFLLNPTFAMEVLKVYTTEYVIPTCLSNDWENAHMHTHTRAHMHTHAHMHMHTHACTHARAHTCTHARTHTHTVPLRRYLYTEHTGFQRIITAN